VPPENDPEGWKTHQPAKFYAKISNARYAEIQFIFSIANPLSFARGTVIPLFLTLSSAESQALDLCSSNGTINVWLCRSVRYHMFPSHAGKIKQTGAEWREEATEFLESAVWWPAPTNDYTKRELNGEIRLSNVLMPSTSIAHLTIKVKLWSFNVLFV
jgi:hypothetical protein